MGIPSYQAHLLEAGSSLKKGESADPRMIRYQTSIYPNDVGVEAVVADLEEFRLIASLQEPRLAPYLTGLAETIDMGLATKASENGKMISALQRDNMQPKPNLPPPQPLDEMNYSESKREDQGNHNY